MGPDSAKFRHFVKILHVFGSVLGIYLVLGTILNLPMPLGNFYLLQKAKYLINDLTIWSHWLRYSVGFITCAKGKLTLLCLSGFGPFCSEKDWRLFDCVTAVRVPINQHPCVYVNKKLGQTTTTTTTL